MNCAKCGTQRETCAQGQCGFGVIVIALGGEATLFKFWHCWVRDGWAVVALCCWLQRLVCCLGCFVQVQSGCGVLRVVMGVEESGGGRLN